LAAFTFGLLVFDLAGLIFAGSFSATLFYSTPSPSPLHPLQEHYLTIRIHPR
jgi:hypothetical protein